MGELRMDGLPEQGDLIAGKYRVERVLGKGGMGVVVAAEHVALKQTVAVKFLLPDAAMKMPEATERFFREARIAASIRNQHVARVMDMGVLENGAPYLVMEYLVGTDLSALLKARTRLPVADAVDYILQAGEALAEVHKAGLVHRDLKPSNLFLAAGPGGVPIIKVLDFGISKVISASAAASGEKSLTSAEMMLGSVYYMAPEQIRSTKSVDARADLWALGVVLYELIAGRRPFRAGTLADLLLMIAREPPPSFDELGIIAPPGLEAAILRCMEKDRERRPQNVAAVGVALKPFGSKLSLMSVENILLIQPGGQSLDDDDVITSERQRPPTVPQPIPHRVSTMTQTSAAPLLAAFPSTVELPSARRRRWRNGLGLVAAFFAAGFAGVWALMRGPLLGAPVEIDAERLASFSPLPSGQQGLNRPSAAAKVKLGRALFSEPKISGNGDVSCATCHPLDRYGVDGKRLSRGSRDREPPRNTLSVYNTLSFFTLMWDGRWQNLETQAEDVLASPDAMDMPKSKLDAELRLLPAYTNAFKEAFPDESDPVNAHNVARALAAFEATLVTRGRWDRFLEGDRSALSEEEKAGFNRFVEVGCVSCHFGESVGAMMFQKVGLVKAWPDTRDRGRFEITKREADWMVFRVPSLRNVEKTAPYFHDGSVTSLEEAIRMMGRHQIGRELSAGDVGSILTWLKSLTGEIPEGAKKPAAPSK